jgi:hypothetical protein
MTIVIDIVTNGRSGAPRLTIYPNRTNPGSVGTSSRSSGESSQRKVNSGIGADERELVSTANPAT